MRSLTLRLFLDSHERNPKRNSSNISSFPFSSKKWQLEIENPEPFFFYYNALSLSQFPVANILGEMKRPKILVLGIFNAAILLLVFSGDSAAGEDSPMGYEGKERDTLYSLKQTFNHPFLNKKWNGLQCYMNDSRTWWYGISCINGRVTGISLQNLGLSGQIDQKALAGLTELALLNFKNNSIFGSIMDFSWNPKLRALDLSANMFEGSISSSLLTLNSLELLHLQENYLTGAVPAFHQISLRDLNVSYNNLSGNIPPTTVLRLLNYSSFKGNSLLCGPPSPNECPSIASLNEEAPKKKKKFNPFNMSVFVVIVAVFDIVALALVIALFCIYYKKKKRANREIRKTDPSEVEQEEEEERKKAAALESKEKGTSARVERGKLMFLGRGGEGGFDLDELLKASAEGLGKGSFGTCYKAMLGGGAAAVVVKRLKDLKPLSSEEFGKLMRGLGDLRHPNLLPLIACYHSKDEQLVVQRFAPNGNLYDRIHLGRGSSNRVPFKWNSRIAVARGVARALAFLHIKSKSPNALPHGNLKSSNVLLDDNDLPLVSDHGFVSLIAPTISVQKMVAYKSPEYQHRRKISKKSDVWCYGSLLLELLTGKISSLSVPEGGNGLDLCTWVHRAVREEWTAEIFDTEVALQKSACKKMVKLLQVALSCCERSPERRPEMEEVAREVEKIKEGDEEEEDSDLSLSEDGASFSISMSSTEASRRVGDEIRRH